MTVPVLEFLKNEAGEDEGLGDAGIETFRDAPYASCAREAGQNARDAAESLPVRMTFNCFSIRQDEFPAHAKLVGTLQVCAARSEQEKEREFFANALAVANRSSIPVLEIADFNTKGLTGPPEKAGTPFHALLKATGVSAKESDTSGGSFGIGKNASFAVSEVQTVLYSTLYHDEDGSEAFAAQGKVKLVSHVDSAGVARRATGYWGNPRGFAAITDPGELPTWMRRSEGGTSIYCMGFREADDWAEQLTSSLVANFFGAVHRGEMVFEIGDRAFRINRSTLEGLLASEEIRSAADKAGDLLDLEFSAQLYNCMVSPNAIESIITTEGYGDFRVRVLTEEGMPRRVGFVRNGMLITDHLKHFGHPLNRFPGSRDFVALVEPADDTAGRLLKRLENPKHNEFSAQRIPDRMKRSAAETVMRKLGKELRDIIKAATGAEHEGSVVLDELAHLFAESGRSDTPPDSNADRDPETHVFVPPKVRQRRRTAPSPGGEEQGGRPGTGTGSGGREGGVGPEVGSGSGGRGQRRTPQTLELRDVRNLIRRDPTGAAQYREVLFSSDRDGPIRIRLQATGVNAPETLRITAADTGRIDGERLVLDVNAGSRTRVLVTFLQPYEGPLEVLADGEIDTEVES